MSVTATRTARPHIHVTVVEDTPLLALPAPPELTLPAPGESGLDITIVADRQSVLGWMHHVGGTLARTLAQAVWDACTAELTGAGYTRDQWLDVFADQHRTARDSWRQALPAAS